MIPVSLKLRNFMAYREAELDFRSFRLAALIGSNGAGKSSLLDAITWALWGKARTNSDDDLVRLGSSEMEVEYTFNFQGNSYRILRKRSLKKGRPELSFQVGTEAGNWRLLSESSIRLTQNKIKDMMKLSYDTFINSVFLLQGRADEFTTKTASQRKEILSDILGLAIYDIYAERAKERAKNAKTEVAVCEAKINQIDEDVAQKATYEQQLAQATQEAETLSQQFDAAEKEAQLLYQQHRAISDKQRQLEDLEHRLHREEADIVDLTDSLAKSRHNVTRYEAILARRAEIEAGLTELMTARTAVTDFDQRADQMNELSRRQHALERAIDAARAKIEGDLRAVETTVSHLTPKVAAIPAQQQQLQEVEAEVAQLTTQQQQRDQQQQQRHQTETEIARLNEQQKQLTTEANTLKKKLAELEEAGADCPVCKRPLDAASRSQAVNQFQNEIEGKRDIFRQLQAQLKQLTGQQTQATVSLAELEAALKPLPTLQGTLANLRQSLAEAEQATAKLQEAEQQRATQQARLANQKFAEAERQTLAEITTALADLNYDRAAHQEAKETVKQLLRFEKESHALTDAEQQLPQEQQRLTQDEARLNRLQEQTATDRATIEQLRQETANLPTLSQQLNQARTQADKLKAAERQARDKMAAANQHLSYLAELVTRRQEYVTALQKAQNEFSIYKTLQAAFGKKGVQALLIESAIPEIEQEANQLLSRMTDGRMHLRFETQRETKTTDNIIETLDIRISDELGTRNYELYSGGEAFRINFAIRIAISKVLARRGGAQLQTLIIDEGFGSQDGQGRERLVESINRIQHDFEKVVVITHVDELKDAFPTRIEVEKTAEGSRLMIRAS